MADAMVIAVSDPSRLMVLDEIAGLLGHRIIARVATLSQITDLLKKTEQSQRVLDEASEGLTFDVVGAEDAAEDEAQNVSACTCAYSCVCPSAYYWCGDGYQTLYSCDYTKNASCVYTHTCPTA